MGGKNVSGDLKPSYPVGPVHGRLRRARQLLLPDILASWRIRLLAPSLIGLLVPGLIGPLAPEATAGQLGPILRISERRIDFGMVEQFQQVHHSLKMANTGDAPLRMLKIEATCGCTAAVPADSVVLPGKEVLIDVAFSTRDYEGEQEKTLTISTNDPAEPLVRVVVTANVRPYVRMEPTVLPFGALKVGQTASQKVRFSSDPDFGMATGKIDGGESFFTVTRKDLSTPKENISELTFTLRPDAPAGKFRLIMKVEVKGKVTRNFDLLAFGDIVSYFILGTDDIRIRMPTASPGKPSISRLPITCDGTKPYTLTRVESSVSFLKCEIVPKGKDYDVLLTVDPKAPSGDYKGKIDILTSDPAQPTISMLVMGFVR
jgi:hypothetical protein